MRINKTARKTIGFISMFMALAMVQQFIAHIRVHRIYDPQVAADLTWMAIIGYGIWWGFKDQTKKANVEEVNWPEGKQEQ